MAIPIQFYDSFKTNIANGVMDLDTDSFSLALLTNLHVFNAANSLFADVVADEIAVGNGYTAGGELLTGVTYTQIAGVAKFDANDTVFTAVAGPMATSRFAVLYDSSTLALVDPLIGLIDFAADKTPSVGNPLTIQWDAANGIFTLT